MPLNHESLDITMRPPGLRQLVLLMCFFNLAGLAFIKGDTEVLRIFFAVLIGAIIIVSFIVLWFFWQGRNWARWLVLITSVIALLNLAYLAVMTPLQNIIIILEAILALFLLYWLNTPSVKGYFIRKRA